MIDVAAGEHHSCALRADGSVWCWGACTFGQLGDPGRACEDFDVAAGRVAGLPGPARQLDAGNYHACVLLEGERDIFCWGADSSGQLGNGGPIDMDGRSLLPALVVGLDAAVVSIAAGGDHTCALLTGGAVRCWGADGYGQLGDGLPARARSVPVRVQTGASAVALAAGQSHTCAVLRGGRVQCWGGNQWGQLGVVKASQPEQAQSRSAVPTWVPGVTGVAKIAAGQAHTCALAADGTISCWGRRVDTNAAGVEAVFSIEAPHGVTAPHAAEDLTAGAQHSCLLSRRGGVYCWGVNYQGQLGTGSLSASTVLPRPLTGVGARVIALDAGDRHTCAVVDPGRVVCWGYNLLGQLGSGDFKTYRATPARVEALRGEARAIAAGAFHTCAIHIDGSVSCWGNNGNSQIGNGGSPGDNLAEPAPVAVVGLSGPVTQLTTGERHSCAVLEGGQVTCWGSNFPQQLGLPRAIEYRGSPAIVPGLPAAAKRVSAGAFHTCAILADGAIHCWGSNASGQLGDRTILPDAGSGTPVRVELGARATRVVAAGWHTCALLPGGGVRCWGRGDAGQLGGGAFLRFTHLPVAVELPAPAREVASTYEHACAVVGANNSVACWGADDRGQLGDGEPLANRASPVAVRGLTGVAAVVTGQGHSCALLEAGSIRCWGDAHLGQLGPAVEGEHATTPVEIPSVGRARALAAGAHHTCALLADGAVVCWGWNRWGQLGDGQILTPPELSASPASVAGLDAM